MTVSLSGDIRLSLQALVSAFSLLGFPRRPENPAVFLCQHAQEEAGEFPFRLNPLLQAGSVRGPHGGQLVQEVLRANDENPFSEHRSTTVRTVEHRDVE